MLFFLNMHDFNCSADFYYFFFSEGKDKVEASENMRVFLKDWLSEDKLDALDRLCRNIHQETIDKNQVGLLESISGWDQEMLGVAAKEIVEKANDEIAKGIKAGKITLGCGEIRGHR